MSKRKPAGFRPGRTRAYLVPALLWLGILAAAWISVSKLSGDRPSADQVTTPATSDQQQGQARNTPSSASAGNGLDTTAQQPASRLQAPPPDKQGQATSQTRTNPATADTNDTQSRHESAPAQTSPAPDQHAENGPGNPARSATSGSSTTSTTSTHVARAQLTSGIKNHEPIDHITGVFHSKHEHVRRLYYFTEFTGLGGETVTHRWWHDGRLMAKVTLRIGDNSWRTYSVKKLLPRMAGAWRVVATDSQGHTLSSEHFVYKTP